HDIRLKEGEVNIIGGLITRTDTKMRNGWPGLGNLPFLHYLFAQDDVEHQEDEVLIVLIPRIVRMPEWTKSNLRPLFSGTESNIQVKRESEVRVPVAQPAVPPAAQAPAQQPPTGNAPTAPGGTPPQAMNAPA